MRSHALEPIPELRPRVRGWLPVELETLVVALLAKRPEDRPRDARAVIEALRAIEIPPEHAWTEVRAQAWWPEHKPAEKQTKPTGPGVRRARSVRAARVTYLTRTGAVRALIVAGLSGPCLWTGPIRTQYVCPRLSGQRSSGVRMSCAPKLARSPGRLSSAYDRIAELVGDLPAIAVGERRRADDREVRGVAFLREADRRARRRQVAVRRSCGRARPRGSFALLGGARRGAA